MGGSWALRQTTSLSVLRDRAPNFVRLSDGGVRNAYALKLGDKTRDVESYALVLDGPAGLQLVVQDAALDAPGRPVLTTRPDGISQWRALVTAPPGLQAAGERAGEIQAARRGAAPRSRPPASSWDRSHEHVIEPRRSAWIPWVFVGGMLLVVAVNGVLIVAAVDTFTGVTTGQRL